MNKRLSAQYIAILIGFGSLLFTALGMASDQSPDKHFMWDHRKMPVLIYLGKNELRFLQSSTQNISNSELIKNPSINLWNFHPDIMEANKERDPQKKDLGLYRISEFLRCVKGDTGCQATGNGREDNGFNEIHFDYWFPTPYNQDDIAMTRLSASAFTSLCPAAGNCENIGYQALKETDIYFKSSLVWVPDEFRETCSKENWGALLVEGTLLHELGHAMGLKDYYDPPYGEKLLGAMNGEVAPCNRKYINWISDLDWKPLTDLYGKSKPTPLSIASPENGAILYAGQTHSFVASSSVTDQSNKPQANSDSSSIQADLNQIEWSSDIDGVLGIGDSISVDHMSPGVHFVTAMIGQPGDAVFGDDVISVKVAERFFTDDADPFHPLPCVRYAGAGNDRCLVRFTKTIRYSECLSLGYYATLDVFDINNNKPVNVTFDNRSLNRCEDWTSEAFSWYFWLDASDTSSKVKATFQLLNQGQCSYLSHVCSSAQYTASIHIVDTTIVLEPIDTECSIAIGETHCSVNLQWSNHFWAPDSAVFYKPLGTQTWIHLQDLGASAGSVELPAFADESGADLAIFQYKNNIGSLVSGPAGLMAGPFTVYGRTEDPLFMGETVFSWVSSQDKDSDSWNVLNGGTTLNLYGNTWKGINYNYTVTADTWLEVDYKSEGPDMPEIAAVVLLSSTNLSSATARTTFQLHGTQTYGNQWFNRYFDDGWKTYRINVGHVLKNLSSSYRNVKYLGFLGDIDASNKQINISYRNPRLFQKNTTHQPQWGHSGSWYNPETSGQGFALEINPINELVVAEWFTYASDGHGKGASSNRWYMQSGSYDPNSSSQDSVNLDIYQVTGGRFNRTNTVDQKVIGTAKLRFFDCDTAHIEYDFYSGYNASRHGYIPLTRLTPNIDCSEDEYTGPHKSDFGYTGNWYNPPTSGQGFAFELNPLAGVLVAQWFTYLPGNSSNLNNPNRQRSFTLVGDYTPGNPNSNSLTIYQSTRGALDDPYPVTTTAVGTANVVFTSCTTARINYSFSSNISDFRYLSGTIDLVRIASNVTCE